MDYKDEQIKLSGVLKDSTQKDIKLSFKTVDLNKITPAINDFNFGPPKTSRRLERELWY